jgi:protein-disulfide isomerase
MLFKSRELEIPQLKQHARELKLDSNTFDKCLDSGEQAPKVNALSTEGQGFGLQGTPSFFINGRFVSGGMSYEQLKTVIDEELILSGKRGKETAKKDK